MLTAGDLITVHFAGADHEEYVHTGVFAFSDEDWLVYVRSSGGGARSDATLMPRERILFVVTDKDKLNSV